MQSPSTPRPAGLAIVPPPLLFVLAFLGGMGLDRIAPLPLVPRALAATGSAVGWLVVAAAAVLLASAALLFARRRTTIVPHRLATHLIASGPYRLTRNPMYVGLTIGCVGAALVANVAWPILLLSIPVWFMNTRTIPFEEQTLERAFGDEYRAYRGRVRRWL